MKAIDVVIGIAGRSQMVSADSGDVIVMIM